MTNLGHHNQDTHLARNRSNIPLHLVLLSQLLKRLIQVLRRLGRCRSKVHSHKELVGNGVTELLEVENVVLVVGEDARDGVDDARLVGAPEGEDVVIGHVECWLGLEVEWV